jgi:hypothetical protein
MGHLIDTGRLRCVKCGADFRDHMLFEGPEPKPCIDEKPEPPPRWAGCTWRGKRLEDMSGDELRTALYEVSLMNRTPT